MNDRPVEQKLNLLFSHQDDFMSLDALSALGDTLAAPEPKPEPPKLRPEDMVSVRAQTVTLLSSRFLTAFDVFPLGVLKTSPPNSSLFPLLFLFIA